MKSPHSPASLPVFGRSDPIDHHGPKMRPKNNRFTKGTDWSEAWTNYVKSLDLDTFERGSNDCCALAAGWASLVSGNDISIPGLTDDAAEKYLEAMGGMEEAVADVMRENGYKRVLEHRHYNYGIVVFNVSSDSRFPISVGVIRGTKIVSRGEHRGLAIIRPISVTIETVYNHPNIIGKWA